MKVKKQHLQLAVAALVLAIGGSIYSLTRGPARPPTQNQIPNPQESMYGPSARGGGPPPSQSIVKSVDPTTIPAPPAVGRTVLSPATRDPFLFGNESREVREALVVPAGVEPLPDSTLPVVKIILVSPTRRVALIENKMVAVGEKIGEFTVTQIDRDGVTFQLPSGERKKAPLHTAEPGSAGVVIR